MPVELRFNPTDVREHMNSEPWERYDSHTEVRSVGLGSIFALTPSGKVYAPFANSNLRPCPGCNGTGRVRSRVKRRVVKKWLARDFRMRTRWVKTYTEKYKEWPAAVRKESAHLNKLLARADTCCLRCGSYGSHEAWDDELWYELAKHALEEVGLSLETNEGDGAYLMATEYRDIQNTEEEGGADKDEDEEDASNL